MRAWPEFAPVADCERHARQAFVLDGDQVRNGLGADLGFP